MKTFTKQLCAALIGVVVLSSCSRPVAYFQRGPVENYHTPKTETVAVVTPVEAAQPALGTTAAEPVAPVAAVSEATPANAVAQANTAMTQLEAYVRNDSKLAADKNVSKRIARAKQLLATAATKATTTPNATASPKKMNLLERMATKHIDKQIKHKLAPDQTKRTMAKSLLKIGLIVGLIGLILLLVGNGFGATLGLIGLIGGAVLVIVDLGG